MKKDYKTGKVTILQQKEFLLNVCKNQEIREYLCDCMTKKHIKNVMKHQNIYHYLLQQSIDMLYQVQSYKEMENVIVIMNSLFDNQEYIDIKKRLFHKLYKQHITLEIYCVLRHLIYLPCNTFPMFIDTLHQKGCSYLECAKFCLIEDQYQLAIVYLQQLDHCEDETVLDLLASHNLFEYMSLKRNYVKKKKDYCLTMA